MNNILTIVVAVFMLGGSLTAEAQRLPGKTWTIEEGKGGGRAGRMNGYSISSDGMLVETVNSKSTTRKIGSAELQQLANLVEGLRLPGTKTKIVKGAGIYDGYYGGFTVTLDGVKYKLEGNSFYNEKQLVLSESQKRTLDGLKRKLTEIRAMGVY